MGKATIETMRDHYKEAAHRREILYALLEQLEMGSLSETERQSVTGQARALIAEFKREREQMLVYIAEETAFVDEAETRLNEIENVNKAKRRLVRPAPTNAQIDAQERRLHHFAQGKSFYKLFWVFFIGCFVGVVVEQLWCLVRTGTFEPRVGLIYGPFNPVYGIGAVALTLALYPFRNHSKLLSLLGGLLIGSAVEYACSFLQETILGSVSWDYSSRPFNLNGRICLQYSLYWGLLGVLWIKELYPRLARWILKIPNRVGRPLTLALCAFMVFNCVMSGLSVLRWVERREGQSAGNRVEVFFDERYPDERMEKIFTNLVFTE